MLHAYNGFRLENAFPKAAKKIGSPSVNDRVVLKKHPEGFT